MKKLRPITWAKVRVYFGVMLISLFALRGSWPTPRSSSIGRALTPGQISAPRESR